LSMCARCSAPQKQLSMPRMAFGFSLLSVSLSPASAFENFGGKPRGKHEWTYEEFKRHHEDGHIPGHDWHDKLEPTLVERLKPKITDSHHEFRAIDEHEKQARYEQWMVKHTMEHEQAQHERTMHYQLSYLLFHWSGGVVGLSLMLLKVIGLVAGCWCLATHKRKRTYDDDRSCSPFSRSPPRKRD